MAREGTLGINGLGRIGKLTVWYEAAARRFDRLVVNTGREVGKSLDAVAHYLSTDSTYGSLGRFLHGHAGPRDAVKVVSEDYGIDLEAEIVIVTDDVPMAATPEQAASHIQLVGLVNDVSLRNLIPAELAKGFGFLQSKPRSALSPVFVTPDELGDAWRDSKLHLPLLTHVNGTWFGAPEAGVDMQFDFAQLVAHAAKTRPLSAGTIVGSGTVANEDTSLGASCFAEQRTVETLRDGKPSTPFMSFGDTVRIEVLDRDGASIFGAIEQRIERQPVP